MNRVSTPADALLLSRLQAIRLIPVVAIDSAREALAVGASLISAGLPCMEITFRTPAAAAALKAVRLAYPSLLLSAGTIVTRRHAEIAIDSGVDFLVSPGTDLRLVKFAAARDVPLIPGVCTPTEIQTAYAAGVRLMKFFPAEAAGGIELLRSFGGPFPSVAFIPTGGIRLTNLAAYLSERQVIACAGSWMVPEDILRVAGWDAIEKLAKESIATASHVTRHEPKAGVSA